MRKTSITTLILFLANMFIQAQDPAPYTQQICGTATEAFWSDGDFTFSCSSLYSEFTSSYYCADTVYLEFTDFDLDEGDSVLIFSIAYAGVPPNFFQDPVGIYSGNTLPPIHKFTNGEYSIHVFKTNANSSSSFEGNWYTLPYEFDVEINFQGEFAVGEEIQFDTINVYAPEGTDGFAWAFWDFGDGGDGYGPSVTHVFNDAGDFNVVLNAQSFGGCSSFDTTQVSIITPDVFSFYYEFPDQQALWNYQYINDIGEATSGGTTCLLYGDTLINALIDGMSELHMYNKINCSDEEQGYIREEEKVIYFIPDTSENSLEYELYNFNLLVGDEIIDPFGGNVCEEDIIVEILDSIEVSNGYRKHWIFSNGIEWIEGMGSMNYLLRPNDVLCTSGNDILICVTNESNLIYNTSNGCVLSIGENSKPEISLSISPNPVSNKLKWSISDALTIDRIVIYSINGRIEIELEGIMIHDQNIDVSSLHSGFYLLEVSTRNGHRFVRRFVVE